MRHGAKAGCRWARPRANRRHTLADIRAMGIYFADGVLAYRENYTYSTGREDTEKIGARCR